MNPFKILFLSFILFSCTAQDTSTSNVVEIKKDTNKIEAYYALNLPENKRSKSIGSVSKGSLENGVLVPFSGKNFLYFDTISYLNGRAFTHTNVLKTILSSYKNLASNSAINYRLMECSNKHGGKIYPHRTHQNGLSIDFMIPLLKKGKSYTALDNIGVDHYLLDFNDNGELKTDTTITVDLNEVAKHILDLEKESRKNNLRIKKIIIKIAYKDELFATEYGKKLKTSGIYIVRNLSPLIDSLHDDHYHIDFEEVN